MNNQDKADEIANDLENCNLDRESAWQGAMNMADWKDEQAIEQKQALIDKACDFLSRAINEWNGQERHRTFYLDREGCLRNFKQAMEE